MRELSDVRLVLSFGLDPDKSRVTRVSADCAVISSDEDSAALAAGHLLTWGGRRLAQVRRDGSFMPYETHSQEMARRLNQAKALFARAGVAAPDAGGEFIHVDSGYKTYFLIPTPAGRPVRIMREYLTIDADGRIANMLASRQDVEASAPDDLERALLPAARGDASPHLAHEVDIVTLYRLRGGDAESRFAPGVLNLLGRTWL